MRVLFRLAGRWTRTSSRYRPLRKLLPAVGATAAVGSIRPQCRPSGAAAPWTVFVKKVPPPREAGGGINACSKAALDVNEDKTRFIVLLRSDVFVGSARVLATACHDCKRGAERRRPSGSEHWFLSFSTATPWCFGHRHGLRTALCLEMSATCAVTAASV
jgi:hypothetical protein